MDRKAVVLLVLAALSAAACNINGDDPFSKREPDAKYVGQTVGNFDASEWYPGGAMGTTENVTEGCYEDETPAVTAQGLEQAFNLGEYCGPGRSRRFLWTGRRPAGRPPQCARPGKPGDAG